MTTVKEIPLDSRTPHTFYPKPKIKVFNHGYDEFTTRQLVAEAGSLLLIRDGDIIHRYDEQIRICLAYHGELIGFTVHHHVVDQSGIPNEHMYTVYKNKARGLTLTVYND